MRSHTTIAVLTLSLMIAANVMVALAVGCVDKRERIWKDSRGALLALAAVKHNCKDVKIKKHGAHCGLNAWALIDACGTQRYYEYGRWCDECPYSWRERSFVWPKQEGTEDG